MNLSPLIKNKNKIKKSELASISSEIKAPRQQNVASAKPTTSALRI
jgi:hypothetical protein